MYLCSIITYFRTCTTYIRAITMYYCDVVIIHVNHKPLKDLQSRTYTLHEYIILLLLSETAPKYIYRALVITRLRDEYTATMRSVKLRYYVHMQIPTYIYQGTYCTVNNNNNKYIIYYRYYAQCVLYGVYSCEL